MPTYYTDENGARFEVVPDPDGGAHLQLIEDAPPAPTPPPTVRKAANRWAEVYKVNDCGECRRADCPRCQARFLDYLRENGSKTGSL